MRRVYDPEDADVNAYGLLTSVVVPRPIAWVTTRSASGVENLAPHSFFTVASADPPVVAFTSVGHKDTLRNVLETEEFTVSLANLAMMPQVNDTSAPFDAEVDEAAALGIETAPSTVVATSRPAASPASVECRLHSTVDLGDSVMVLGRVVAISVDEAVLGEDGRPSYALMQPVSRLGGSEWGLPSETRSVRRPASPDDLTG